MSRAVTLELPFTPPYDWYSVLRFLGPRAIPGVESACDGRYRRTFSLDGARGIVEVRRPARGHALLAAIRTSDEVPIGKVTARLRHLFDLDADSPAIDRHLARSSALAPLVATRPGIRVPGTWDPFELSVRAILGQQVSVVAATTLAGRLAATYGVRLGEGDMALFPVPAALARADLRGIGLPRARAEAISRFAAAVLKDPRLLEPDLNRVEMPTRLMDLPGIGPWTAQYISMRAAHHGDAFPSGDLGLLKALIPGQRATPAELLAQAESWRPWRAYAAMHLWMRT
jgi:AraC family transcriptional regulator of adaptative response / DNA-3-methyladenine glycosylase II